MIIYRPYKFPTKRLNLTGRMRRIRSNDRKSTRALQNWFKRRQRW